MHQLKVIIGREYMQRVKQKSFAIVTIIGVLVILVLSLAPGLLDKIKTADRLNFAVLAQDGSVADYLQSALQEKLPDGEPRYNLTESIQASPADWEGQKTRLLGDVREKGTILLEVFPPGSPQTVTWYSAKVIGSGERQTVEAALQQMAVETRIKSAGLTQEQFSGIFAPLEFKDVVDSGKADHEGETKGASDQEKFQNIALVYILLFFLYFALVIYGAYVAQGVVEEKSSRIMEMMLASVKPTTMMAGKILGIGAVGLTQFVIWIAAGVGLLSFNGAGLLDSLGAGFSLGNVNPGYFFLFGLFFVLGFLMYAAVYAGLGSMVSRVEDANQVVTPVTMLLVVAFMVAMFSLTSPDNPWIVGLSYFPFFTPMLMFSRVVLTHVSPLSVILGIGIMILTIIVLIWLAARIYRAGVLMYGKVSWKDAFRVLRQK